MKSGGGQEEREREKDSSVLVPWEDGIQVQHDMLSSKKAAFSNQLMSCMSIKFGYPKDAVQESHNLLLELGEDSKFLHTTCFTSILIWAPIYASQSILHFDCLNPVPGDGQEKKSQGSRGEEGNQMGRG